MLIVWIIPCPPIRRPLTRIHLIYPTIYVYMPIRSPLLTILALSPEKFGHLENVIQKLATIHRDKLTCWWSDSTHLSWLKQTILIYRSIDLWIYDNLWQSMTIYDDLCLHRLFEPQQFTLEPRPTCVRPCPAIRLGTRHPGRRMLCRPIAGRRRRRHSRRRHHARLSVYEVTL